MAVTNKIVKPHSFAIPFIISVIPGFLVILSSLSGYVPGIRDLPSYFVPLRFHTAEVLRGNESPWWNPYSGAGEPYFANPQSALMYPPAWAGLIFDPAVAVGVEAGLHLMILGAGICALARKLGASAWGQVAAAIGATLSGPIADSAGVLNNLNTITWLPWLWGAALSGSVPLISLFFALSYLGAEPQLAAAGAVIALILKPDRKTFVSLLIGVSLIAVQAVPFYYWIRNGDRGPHIALSELTLGSTHADELVGLIYPAAKLPHHLKRYVDHLYLPLWALFFGVIALVRGKPETRKLAGVAFILLVVSLIAGTAWGGSFWRMITAGLVRYPGRLLFISSLCLLPAAAAMLGAQRLGKTVAGIILAVYLIAGIRVHNGVSFSAVWQGATAAATLVSPFAPIIATAGSTGLLPHFWRALTISASEKPETDCLAEEIAARGRIYSLQPSAEQFRWVLESPERRQNNLGWGYFSLLDKRRMTRTFAPLQSQHLAKQISAADQGPSGKWWLDASGSKVIVSHRALQGFPELCKTANIYVYTNSDAWDPAMTAKKFPAYPEKPVPAGHIEAITRKADQRIWKTKTETDAYFLMMETPDPGWRFTIDEHEVIPQQLGIIQAVPLPRGEHQVTARYRPPGFIAGLLVSVVGLLALGLSSRRNRKT